MFIFRRRTEETKLTTHCHLMPPTIQFFDADEAISADLMTTALKPQTE